MRSKGYKGYKGHKGYKGYKGHKGYKGYKGYKRVVALRRLPYYGALLRMGSLLLQEIKGYRLRIEVYFRLLFILFFIIQSCFMMIDLVKYPVLTEKTARQIEKNQYTFDVDLRLSKPQIKKLIEELFEVVVISVNTHRPPRKKKRLGLSQGFKTSYKRVIITVKSMESNKIFPEVNKIFPEIKK